MVKQLFYRFCRACARNFAKRHKPLVIGVTGSVGKTSCRMIVTEILQQIFPQQRIVTSKKNFNSELGLALSLLQIEEYAPTFRGTCKVVYEVLQRIRSTQKPYDVIFLEYGIDYIGEMEIELSIVHPHIAIFTMIDKVHAMNIGTMEQILNEKAKLLKAAKEMICIPLEMQEMLKHHLVNFKGDVMTYSFKENNTGNANYMSYHLKKDAGGLPMATSKVTVGDASVEVHASLLGQENMGYISLGLLIARLLAKRRNRQDPLKTIEVYYFPLHLQDSRFSIFCGKYDSVIVDSSYNAAPQSMRKMIANVQDLQKKLYPRYELWLCLGEMRELGTYTEDEHRMLMHEILHANRLYLLGAGMLEYGVDELKRMPDIPTYKTFATSQDLGRTVLEDLSKSEANVLILCKGSQNTIYLEEAVKILLEDDQDTKHLCRQTNRWLEKKEKQGFLPYGKMRTAVSTTRYKPMMTARLAIVTLSIGALLSGCALRNGEPSHPIVLKNAQQNERGNIQTPQGEPRGNTGSKACFGTACFWMEVADTPVERSTGLMYRKSMPEDGGMVFVFDMPGKYSFWMKNTLIPLDMLRLDEEKKIIYIAKDVPPCKADPCPSYGPESTGAMYVVELNAGISIHKSITTGMSVTLDIVR